LTVSTDVLAPRDIPSVDRLLNDPAVGPLVATHGRAHVTTVVRAAVAALRRRVNDGESVAPDEGTPERLVRSIAERLRTDATSRQRRVFNMTGVVLHTNLGRALMAEEAIEAAVNAMRHPVSVEYDIERGARGERDEIVEALVCELTGAEAATVLNNNAAAVLIALGTLAQKKEVVVSRGELIEIGGAFRIPDVMSRAGCRLREVGTTNRTHPRDYAEAIGPKTAMLLKVHTSNYAIVGFTSEVTVGELAPLARERGLTVMEDLGSGTLVDLAAYGLPHERTPAEAIRDGADLVTFSGDKLLGGPQCGIIAGRRELVAKIRRNPLKRALRVDKVTLAMLDATLRLYRDPDRLRERLTTLRLLTRPAAEITAQAERLLGPVRAWVGEGADVAVQPMKSQIGSGSKPLDLLPSAGLAITVGGQRKGAGSRLARIEARLRALPIPVIGRIERDALLLDCRCVVDEAGFVEQLADVRLPGVTSTP